MAYKRDLMGTQFNLGRARLRLIEILHRTYFNFQYFRGFWLNNVCLCCLPITRRPLGKNLLLLWKKNLLQWEMSNIYKNLLLSEAVTYLLPFFWKQRTAANEIVGVVTIQCSNTWGPRLEKKWKKSVTVSAKTVTCKHAAEQAYLGDCMNKSNPCWSFSACCSWVLLQLCWDTVKCVMALWLWSFLHHVLFSVNWSQKLQRTFTQSFVTTAMWMTVL